MTWMCTVALLSPDSTMNLKRISHFYYLKFIRLKGDPQSLAQGTAIGTFIGITPTIPFHTVSILLATFITRASTVAALLASFIWCNPLTYVPQYYFSLAIGNKLTPYTVNWERIKSVLNILLSKPSFAESMEAIGEIGYEAIIVLLAGGTILALPFTIASYFLSLKLFITVRQKRNMKHILS